MQSDKQEGITAWPSQAASHSQSQAKVRNSSRGIITTYFTVSSLHFTLAFLQEYENDMRVMRNRQQPCQQQQVPFPDMPYWISFILYFILPF